MLSGVVENVNVDPPLDVVNAVALTDETTEKSLATPVVALTSSDTLMVHTTGRPVREGFVLEHERLDEVAGLP